MYTGRIHAVNKYYGFAVHVGRVSGPRLRRAAATAPGDNTILGHQGLDDLTATAPSRGAAVCLRKCTP